MTTLPTTAPPEADPNRISYDCVFLNEIVVPEPDSNPEIVFARIRVPVPRDQILFDSVVVAADNHAADIQPHELDFSATIRMLPFLIRTFSSISLSENQTGRC